MTREGHPAGEDPGAAREVAREAVKVDTLGGTVHVEWDPDAAVTLLGHLAFFAEYLKVSGRFDAQVTVHDAAARLGVTSDTVHRWRKAGLLRGHA